MTSQLALIQEPNHTSGNLNSFVSALNPVVAESLEFERFYLHEVRNLVGAVELFSAQLEQQLQNEEDVNVVCITAKRLRRLSSLIVELTQEFNKVHHIRNKFQGLKTNLNATIDECRDALQIMSHTRGYDLCWQIQNVSEKHEVNVPSRHLLQILFNLVLNAMNAGKNLAEKNICISISVQFEECTFLVSDKAGGIDFLNNRQSEKSVIHHSWGIGLLVVNRILQEAQGSLAILSTEGGSTFKFTLPCSTV